MLLDDYTLQFDVGCIPDDTPVNTCTECHYNISKQSEVVCCLAHGCTVQEQLTID
jgi:hypothetical protein